MKEKEVTVLVKLTFSINVPEAVNTPDKIMAEHLVSKLSLEAQWAKLKSREIL